MGLGRVKTLGLDVGDENIAGGEGQMIQVRTDPSGLLGCTRRGVRASATGAGTAYAVEWARGPPVGKAMRWQAAPAPCLCVARGPTPADFPCTPALRFTAPR